MYKNNRGQAVAGPVVKMDETYFDKKEGTEITWMGSASILINSHNTQVMIDPLLVGFDMPLLIEMPLICEEVPHLDGILITHIDNDHFSRPTCQKLKNVCDTFYAPNYVAEVMKEEGYPVTKEDIHDKYNLKDLEIVVTPAKHNWQNGSKKWSYRYWDEKDYCGYYLTTPEGTIWLPGDSKLLDEHLHMPEPDVILFDFADNEWHITLDGAIKLANTYPSADLICIHWGTVDAPDMTPFNGNPENLFERVVNPERIKVLAPGETYKLSR